MANVEITKSKLLVVEGKDEDNFFKSFLKHLKNDDVDIVSCNGKEKLRTEIPALLKRPDFRKVKSYAIIVDADESLDDTFKSVAGLLKNNKEPIPKEMNQYEVGEHRKVGIYCMPGNVDKGMLEDLFLQVSENHPALPHAVEYISKLESILEKKLEEEPRNPNKFYYPKTPSKAKALALLAALYEPINSIGVAAIKGYWDFEHPSLSKLKEFLNQL